MASNRLKVILVVICIWLATPIFGQNSRTLSEQEIEAYKKRAADLVTFFQFMLNTVGDESTPVKDKETIVSSSYLKIFSSSEVQIEDDLLQDRAVITNKTIASYLRDVDFFFKNAHFQFDIISVTMEQHEAGGVYFKVTLERKLSAVSVDLEKIQTSQRRFVEINWNEAKDDLKIASIYTTRVSRDEELQAWWNSLSFEWRSIFFEIYKGKTEMDLATLYKILDTDSIDLAGNSYLTDLKPLELLTKLKKINISRTNISDLSPLRGLTQLQLIQASYTPIEDLSYLRYCSMLKDLDLSYSQITTLEGIDIFTTLSSINLAGLAVSDHLPLEDLTELEYINLEDNSAFSDLRIISRASKVSYLNISGTSVNDLSPISSFTQLKTLDFSRTSIDTIEPLINLLSLEKVSMNNCPINSIVTLSKLSSLRRIYSNNTAIDPKETNVMMKANNNLVIVLNAQENEIWWDMLSSDWKALLLAHLGQSNSSNVSSEQLVRLLIIDSLNLQKKIISDASPLKQFTQLKTLNISFTPISNLEFIENLNYLQALDISYTPIENVAALGKLPNLKTLYASNSKLKSISPLISTNLTYLDVDNTGLRLEELQWFVVNKPTCLVIYDTHGLTNWWINLPELWKRDLSKNINANGTLGSSQLHQLVALPMVKLSGQHIINLDHLQPFLMLKELEMSNTQLQTLNSVPGQLYIEKIIITKSPVTDIAALQNFVALHTLDISNTPVEKLDALSGLKNLRHLNISGTNVSHLKDLETITTLQSLDCSNTPVKNLNSLSGLRQLQSLSCYNTKINEKRVEELKKDLPNCNIVYY